MKFFSPILFTMSSSVISLFIISGCASLPDTVEQESDTAAMIDSGLDDAGLRTNPADIPEESNTPEDDPTSNMIPPMPGSNHPTPIDPHNLCPFTRKVIICHIPPGNPENAHSLRVSRHAVLAHITHHDDYIGRCGDPQSNQPYNQ